MPQLPPKVLVTSAWVRAQFTQMWLLFSHVVLMDYSSSFAEFLMKPSQIQTQNSY